MADIINLASSMLASEEMSIPYVFMYEYMYTNISVVGVVLPYIYI